uniref:Uncharacterized protein n=1 Tax=Rhizophora mucronata TaxID=61149 RepID=A0A2P2P483_RHIMU
MFCGYAYSGENFGSGIFIYFFWVKSLV